MRIISLFNFTLQILIISFHSFSATPASGQLFQDLVCTVINCGQGTCVASNATLGFDCACNSGWKEIQVGTLTFPSCVVPNCTIDFQCGGGAPLPPPPPLALPPPSNTSSPCNLVWCGDGTCVANGTGHSCWCNDGSANLFDQPALACVKQCSLGADCKGLRFGPPLPPPPPPQSSSSSGSPKNGSNEAPKCLVNFRLLIILVLSVLLAWF